MRELKVFIEIKGQEILAREVGLAEAFVYNVFDDVAGKLESALSTAAEELEQTGFDDAIATEKTVLEVGGYRYID